MAEDRLSLLFLSGEGAVFAARTDAPGEVVPGSLGGVVVVERSWLIFQFWG